jgi:ketosteroid isomerase-like protein
MSSITDTLTADAEIRELIDDKTIAVYNRDEKALLAKYAPGLITFDLAQPLQNNGGMEARLQQWFAGYMGHISQEVTNVEITAGEDIAYSHCLMRTWGTSIEGRELDMWYRVTSCYKKLDGEWRITHEHLSEPIDMENGKALFTLKP